MLQIRHKGNQISLDVDADILELDVASFQADPRVLAFKAGKVVGINAEGFAVLADGDETQGAVAIGFLINDMAGNFYENKPALASGKVATTMGNCVVVTDQVDPSIIVTPGQKLYVGTGAKAGLLTNAVVPNARCIGTALGPYAPATPELLVNVLG